MCDGTALEALQRRSYDLHHELARQLDGASSYNFRSLQAFSIDFGDRTAGAHEGSTEQSEHATAGPAHRPSWLSDCVHMQRMRRAPPGTTAQVNPRKFTQTIASAAVQAGARLLEGKAGRVVGVSV